MAFNGAGARRGLRSKRAGANKPNKEDVVHPGTPSDRSPRPTCCDVSTEILPGDFSEHATPSRDSCARCHEQIQSR
jgi:hypothetical protein